VNLCCETKALQFTGLPFFAPIYVLTSGGPNDATMVPSYLTYYHFFTTNRVGYAAAISTSELAQAAEAFRIRAQAARGQPG